MPELRGDALTGDEVLLAPSRSTRPHTTPGPGVEADPGPARCPFCPGHEAETPPEVARVGDGEPGGPGWRARAFPNKYPIVGGPDAGPGATGAHEVVVLSPDHRRDLAALSDRAADEALGLVRARARALGDAGHAHVQVCVNQGRAAGASIAHPHAQLVALDVVPPAVTAALARFAARADLVAADWAAAEAAGQTLVDGPARAWCPVGSSSPYEVRVAAPGAGRRFADASDGELGAVTRTVRDVLDRLAALLGAPPYNVVVYDAPTTGDDPYHWWVRVVPRLEVAAGFELGTGLAVESVDPARSAAALRERSSG